MGSIRRRLSRLEAREPGWGYREDRLLNRALAQMETEDLHVLTRYLDRGDGMYAQPTEPEAAVLHRLGERLEEVTNGH